MDDGFFGVVVPGLRVPHHDEEKSNLSGESEAR